MNSTKDRDVPQTTVNGNDPAPCIQPRCRVCRLPEVRQRVNRQLAEGWSLSAILQSLSINSSLPANRRITKDSLETHRARHFPLQAGASSVWRSMLEARVEAEAADFATGVFNLITPRAFLEVVLAKSYAGLAAEGAEIGPELGLRAAAELQKMSAADSGTEQMARIMATQNRIIACMREVCPPELHEEILARCEGRPWPPPSGGRLALVEGGADDDEPDPFSDDTEDYDQDDD